MVRNRVLFAVYCTIVQGDAVPTDYGMFTEEGDASVRAAVAAFVRTARGAAARLSPRQRIDALWGDAWGRDVLVSKSDCSSLRWAARRASARRRRSCPATPAPFTITIVDRIVGPVVDSGASCSSSG